MKDNTFNPINGRRFITGSGAFTWRAGAVYLFDNGLAPYASYAESFQPQVTDPSFSLGGVPFQDGWSATITSFCALHFGNFAGAPVRRCAGAPVRWAYFLLTLAAALALLAQATRRRARTGPRNSIWKAPATA